MASFPYDIEKYNSVLGKQVAIFVVGAIIVVIMFSVLAVMFAREIKEDKTKKFPYVRLVLAIVLGATLFFGVVHKIFNLSKDIAQEAYIQYEGSLSVKEHHWRFFGVSGITHTDYIITFEQDGNIIELSLNKNYALTGDVENVYLVYSKRSMEILEFIK